MHSHSAIGLGVAWVGTRSGDTDTGKFQWGGHAVFRELVQHADGTLGSKFPPEMIPVTGALLPLSVAMQTAGVTVEPSHIHLNAGESIAAARLANLPRNVYIRVTGRPGPDTPRFGLRVRETTSFVDGVALELLVAAQCVELHDAAIDPVTGLDAPFTLEIVLKDDLIDICLNQRYCLINRCPEQRGNGITFFCHTGSISFENVTIRPLVERGHMIEKG